MFTQAHTTVTTKAFGAWCAPLAAMPSAAIGLISFGYPVEGNRLGRSDTLLPEVYTP
jgi:hypothetical protein